MVLTKYAVFALVLIGMLALLPGLNLIPENRIIPSQSAERDYWPTDDWVTGIPEDHGMDSDKLALVEGKILEQDYSIDSVLVVRDGYLLYEYYGDGWEEDEIHMIQSCTKCVTSTLVGIAIQQGFIGSVDDYMVDYFSEWTIENMDDRKQNITIEHLLTWTDGMEFHEIDYPYDDPRNDLGQMWVSEDALQYCLDRPMWNDPGESWWMNSGTLIILGGIIEIVSGMSILEFATQYLFEPLGITYVYWSKIGGGNAGGWYHTDGGLHMIPRDFAKFGYLMLNNGTWDGEQILPTDWVAEATIPRINTEWSGSYAEFGYQWWWWESEQMFSAHGHYEQAVYISPGDDLVVVINGNVPDGEFYPADYLVSRYIVPAVGVADGSSDPFADFSFIIGGVLLGVVSVVALIMIKRRTVNVTN